MSEQLHAADALSAGLIARTLIEDRLNPVGVYHVECVGPREECRTAYLFLRDRYDEAIRVEDTTLAESIRGQMAEMEEVKWADECPNLVTTQGKNAMLDKFLDLGSAYAGAAIGLHTTVGNASSTYGTPSPQVEATVIAARLAPTFSAASSGSKALSSSLSFSITGSATITGCFLVLGATGILTVGNTAATAILFSSGSFSGGSRAVVNGDSLVVSYSLAL